MISPPSRSTTADFALTDAFVLGAKLGSLGLSSDVLARSKDLAVYSFATAAEEAFSGDPIVSWPLPAWLRNSASWLPAEGLATLGFELDPLALRHPEIVATASVGRHIDRVLFKAIMVILHNDGLTFRQGRQAWTPAAGDWTIFDDSKPHEVRPSTRSTCLIAVVAAVRQRSGI